MVDIMDKSQRKVILMSRRPKAVYRGEPLLGAWYTEEEVEAAVKAIRDSMDWHVGFGFICEEIQELEEAFARYIGTEFAISINGAGTGLDMAMMCLDLEPGDEVICPAVNFVAAHLAVLGQQGKLVFCEVDPKTLNVDPNDVEHRITPRTRAIFPVHFTGLSAPMDDLLDIAERHPHPKHGPLKVIGDAARACGGTYRGTRIGKKGWMTVFSFHTQKLMTTLGEGGMVTTDDPDVEKRLRAYRQFGHTTDGWGTNYKMTKVQAAVGLVQLRRLDEMNALRAKRARQRSELLKNIAELTLPHEPPDCVHTYYLYAMLVPREWAGEKRNRLMEILEKDYQVGSMDADARMYKDRRLVREHTAGQEVPISDETSERIVCPSLHPLMTGEENEYICAAIAEAVERVKQEGKVFLP
jgi:dTDP-4-amino-4,6-dideoxygalactose transaminase